MYGDMEMGVWRNRNGCMETWEWVYGGIGMGVWRNTIGCVGMGVREADDRNVGTCGSGNTTHCPLVACL